MTWFGAITLVGWLTVVLAARLLRSATFAMFVGVLVGIYSLVAVGLRSSFDVVLPLYATLHVIVFVNFLFLSKPRMRRLPYRVLVSWPASFFAGGRSSRGHGPSPTLWGSIPGRRGSPTRSRV